MTVGTPIRQSPGRFVVVAVAAALAAMAACGRSSPRLSTGAIASLTVEWKAEPNASPRLASLMCAAGGGARGTGYLASPDAAGRACAAVVDPANAGVFGPPPSDQMCSMIFSGPESAHVTGELRGRRVDVTLARKNGCETTNWNKVGALVTP